MAARRPRTQARKTRRTPVTSATAAARQQLVSADVLALAATQARMGQATKGIFGTRPLRAAGSLSSYFIAEPVLPRIPKPPKRPSPTRPRNRR